MSAILPRWKSRRDAPRRSAHFELFRSTRGYRPNSLSTGSVMTDPQHSGIVSEFEPAPPLQFAAFVMRHRKLVAALSGSFFVLSLC